MSDTVVLAYSGGLDTSFCIPYLKEQYGFEVVAVTCDIGQEDDFDLARERALALGAKEHVLLDLKQEFFERFLAYAIKANALYEKAYPLHSSMQGYLILEKIVGIARERGAKTLAHGNSGLGNDQLRYDIPSRILAPDMKIVAPVRDSSMNRQQEWDYLAERNLPLPNRPSDNLYSVADNLWGTFRGHVGAANEPDIVTPKDVLQLVEHDPKGDENYSCTIGFECGVPVSLDGKKMPGHAVVSSLNSALGDRGYGAIDYVESSVFGTKIRQTVEGPAALALIHAHEDLERLCLSRRQLSTKSAIETRWAEYVFDGMWGDPACRDIEVFVDSTQSTVTGEVTMARRGMSFMPVARSSPHSLYNPELYSYDESMLDHRSGAAFAEMWGRGTVMAARVRQDLAK